MKTPKYVYFDPGTEVEKISTYKRVLKHIAGNAWYLRCQAPITSWVVVFSTPQAAKNF